MLRTLPIIVALLLWASVAWGVPKDCTLGDDEALDWGGIGLITSNAGDCEEVAAIPDSDDVIMIPDGSDVDIIADITFVNTDESGIEVLSGGSLTASAIDQQDAIVITLYNGQDTGGETNVALWGEAGSTITLQGGYLERFMTAGPAALVETISEADGTIWTVDLVTTCDPGDDNTTGGILGGGVGERDCTTGNQEQLFTFAYTDSRNNPDQTDADNHLEEAIDGIGGSYMVCMLTGMDAGHCYSVASTDGTAATYNITVTTRQIPGGYTNAAFPLAMRDQILLTTEDAGQKGDTCIESDASAIAASGDLAGACAYFYNATGDAGWSRPLRISKTENALDCAGGAGNDAFHFAAESPLLADIVDASQVVISPMCVSRGDKYAILAPVVLSCISTRTDGQCQMILEGTTTMRGVVIDGAGVTKFDGATADLGMVHVRAGGDADGFAMVFDDMTNVTMSYSTVVGGPVAGAGEGLQFTNITGHVHLSDVAARYIGGDQFKFAGTSMGTAKLERVSCERIGNTGMDAGDSCIEDITAKLTYLGIQDLFFTDAAFGNTGSVIRTEAVPATLNGLAIYGQTEGGISAEDDSKGLEIYNLYGRGIVSGRSGPAGAFLDTHLSNCDIDDMTYTAGAEQLMSPDGPTLRNCIFKNVTTSGLNLLDIADAVAGGGGAADISNNIFYNVGTSSVAGGEEFLQITFSAGSTVVHTIEDNSFLWDESSLWDMVIDDNEAATTNTINFGGNLIDGFDNSDGATAIAINLDDGVVDGIVYRDNRNNCVSSAVVTGGGTIEYVDDMDIYLTEPILGIAPDYDAINLGKGALRSGSYLAEKRCGARTGPHQPGMGPGHDWLYERMGIPKMRRAVNLNPSKAF